MWSVFIRGPIIVAITTILFSLTGGTQFVIAASVLNALQRRKGFRAGEGFLSRRANDERYGVEFRIDSEYQICSDLGIIAEIAPKQFGSFLPLKFDLTLSESIYIGDLLVPALEAVASLSAAQEAATAHRTAETMAELLATANHFSMVVLPIARWFEGFPKSRTKRK